MNILSTPLKRNLLIEAIAFLQTRGHRVTSPMDIPGLFHIDGGPEITRNQLVDFAYRQGFR